MSHPLLPLTALMLAMAATIPGCAARRCQNALVQCRYECQREYQICQVHGNEEFYCRNLIGNCLVNCDYTRAACS